MIICPSCGSKVEGQLCLGCPSCGARAVGPPLAKPEHELVSYGRAVVTAASGSVMLLGFLVCVLFVLITNNGGRFGFSTLVTAGEIAAWRVKWVALPVSIAVLWAGSRLIGSIKTSRDRFAGLGVARLGFAAAIVAMLMSGTLIGITVPERLRRRQWAIEATYKARGYTIDRALQEYRNLHGTLPPQEDFVRELKTLRDSDGSIAEALQSVDVNGYQASTVLAAAATKTKALVPRGGALRNAATNPNPDPPAVSFTNYELRLPGPDKLLNTDDDFVVLDGLIMTLAEFREYKASHSSAP